MNKSYHFLVFTIAAMFAFTACKSDDHHDEVPVGIVLMLGDIQLAMQDTGTITYLHGDFIPVPTGDQSEIITIEFISEDGDRFVPDSSEYSLGYSIANESILDIVHPANLGQWSFRLTGVLDGNTTISFELLHGGHADFESLPFQVQVAAPGGVE